MYVLQADGPVTQIRFLPDGQRLLVGPQPPNQDGAVEVWSLPDGERVRVAFPAGVWASANQVAIHPSGDRCYAACGGHLHGFRTDTGTPVLASAERVAAEQVAVSPGGRHILTIRYEDQVSTLTALTDERVVWRKALSGPWPHHLAAFPADDRFVTIGERRVTVRAFATGDELGSTAYPSHHVYHPQPSPDGRHLGVIGYSSMYFFDLAALGRPRRITGSSAFGNFVSFAFHPDGRTVAVIHGGPTLVKVYDLDSLKQRQKFQWKLGPLSSVAYSPDGTVGAAGSESGKVVVWDVDG